MNYIIYFLFFIFGCAGSVKNIDTIPKPLTIEEQVKPLSYKFTEKDLTLVYIEKSNVLPQNNEEQIFLKKNAITPYDGVLLNISAASYIISEYEAQLERSELAIKKQRDLDLNKLNFETAKLLIEIETIEKKNNIILKGRDEEIKRLQKINEETIKELKRPWKKIIIGVGSAVVGVGAGIIIGNITNN